MERFIKLLAHLHALGVDSQRVVLIGSAPLAIRNLRDVNDLDVLCTPDQFDKLRRHASELQYDDCAAIQTPFGVIQVSSNLAYFTATDVTEEAAFTDADHWGGWLVLSLKHCVAIKKGAMREKDMDDLQLLHERGLA
jgi:hypothetical protein